MSKPVGYTPKMLSWLSANQSGISRKELTERFNKQFDMSLNVGSVKNLCARKKWISGLTGYAEKGSTPWNKGKIGYMGANATSFKKGQMPATHRPVGSERTCSKDGYVLVKIANPNRWKPRHIVAWEKEHGKVPSGHCIRFLDLNKTNCDLSNLICVSREENGFINRHDPANTDNADLNKAIIMNAKLKYAVNNIDKVRSKNVI